MGSVKKTIKNLEIIDVDQNKKILIVEDDQLLRELYVSTLSEEGYQIDTALDGEEALEKIKDGKWDIILLDIVLPKMNGLDIIKKLHSETHTPSENIIFLTNLDSQNEKNEALKLGRDYLIKSQLTPDDIVNVVKKYLS
jgi:two-component system response regulator VicR